jgi:AcrR family transcriptional regulator
MKPTGVYGGVSAEQRRAERRRRLMDAALQIMGTQGWAQTTVRGICREAQLSHRFFYENFDDLDALATAVLDDIVAAATRDVLDALAAAPDDPEAQASAAIGTFVRRITDDPRRARVAFIEALGSKPMMRRRQQTMRDVAHLIAEHGRATYHPPPEADTLVEVTAALLAGGLTELLITWLTGGLDIPREQLIDDCAALFAATGDSAARIGEARAEHAAR